MNRFTKEDKEYCALQQRAYVKSQKMLLKMLTDCEKAEAEQACLLGEDTGVYFNGFGRHISDEIRGWVARDHEEIISRITSYFSEKYYVSLDQSPIEAALLPRYPGLSEGEEARAEYRRAVCVCQIDYREILKQIVAQLGGMTFREKAVTDLKASCRAAAWSETHTKRFVRRKAVISFSFYAIIWKEWSNDNFIYFERGISDIIPALVYFETGEMTRPQGDLARLYACKYDLPVLDTGMKKANRLRFYKNGRMDICFSKEKHAREFAEEFLENAA